MVPHLMIYFCIFSLPQWILAYIIYKVVCSEFRHVTFRNDGKNDIYLHLNGTAKPVAAGGKIDFLCRNKPLNVQITSDDGEYHYPPLDIGNKYEYTDWGAPKVLIGCSDDLRLRVGNDDEPMEVPGRRCGGNSDAAIAGGSCAAVCGERERGLTAGLTAR